MTNAGGANGPNNQDITVKLTLGGRGQSFVQLEGSIVDENGCDVALHNAGGDGVAPETTAGEGGRAGEATWNVTAAAGNGTAKLRILCRQSNQEWFVPIKVNT